MGDIQVRGGSFVSGEKCVFREDHFRFNDGIFTSPSATIYIGDAIEARVIEARQKKTSGPESSEVIGGAGVGALAGAWFSPFSAGVSVAVGAIIGAVAASAAGTTTKPSQITFEMRFTNDRSLIGTVDNSGWADIQEAWRISSYNSTRGRIADISSDKNSKGFVQWLRGFTPWNGR
jgi:hypothetical protein